MKDGLNEDKMIQAFFKKSDTLTINDQSADTSLVGRKAIVKKPITKSKRNFKLSHTKNYRGSVFTILAVLSTIICMTCYIVVYYLVVGNVNKVVDIQKFYFQMYDNFVLVDINFLVFNL